MPRSISRLKASAERSIAGGVCVVQMLKMMQAQRSVAQARKVSSSR